MAVENRVAAGAGAQSQILSGGNMTLAVRDVIDNQYGDIKARGQLWMTGTAAIVNTGATLYRTHTFDGYWYTYDNTKTYYKQDSISEVIGSARGVIEGAQGVFINGRSFTNVDVTAGTVGNIRDSVQVIGSGQSGAGSAGANAASGNGGGAVLGHVTGSGGGTGAVLAGAQSASNGSSLATAGRSSASGVQNQLAGGSATGASGVTNGAGASGNVSGSGAGNGLSVHGAAGASGVRNDGQTTVIAHAGADQIGAGDVRSLGGAAGQGATRVQGSAIGETRKVAPGGLFLQNQNPSSDYLFETRPQFAKQDQWTSSDFLLDQLARDPALTQKRLGDGFYEQRLVREQLAELTGSAPNKGLSDDTIYKNLLTSGVSAAHEFGLRPGVALSAEQVAHLTSDIVWLVSETVQLPDGRIETVLVPKVYVAHAGKAALTPGGALVTGDGVTISVTDSIANIGGVIDGGNGRTVLVAGQDIVNRGGAIAGGNVALQAGRDIRNESLVVKDSWATQQNSGSTTALSNTASIVTTGALNIDAGRDLTDLAGKLSAGSAVITAGNDIRFDTVKTGSTYDSLISGYTESNSSVTHQLSQVSTGGDLVMKAGGNLNLTGTQVAVGTGGKGNGVISAGGAINIAAVKNEANSSVMNDASSKAYDKQVHRNETIVGAGVAAAGDLTVRAGVGGSADLNVTGSTLAGGGNVALSSTNNVNIASTTENHLSDVATHRESSSTFKKSSATKADYSATTQAIGSSISGNNVSIAAKNDITVGASELAATDALALGAGRDLIVTTAAMTNTERHTLEEKKSGFSVSAGGIGYSKGQEQQTSGSESVTQVGSVLTGANVTTASGRDTVIQGSTVVADDDIAISVGRNLAIVSAQNSVSEDSASSSKQSGMIGSFFQPSIGTVKNKQDGTREAVTQSGSQLASLDGNVTLTAGNTYTQTASDVLTQTGDIVIGANNVLITAAQDTTMGTDHSSYSKTAIGGTVSAPLLEAVRTVASMAEAAKDTGNARLTALAAINAASAISEMPTSVEAVQKAGIRVSIGLSNTKSESTTNSASSTAVGSTIKAGGNVAIIATGAGQASNLSAIGSQITGGDSVTLAADNKVNLMAAESTASQHSTNKSSGSSIGVGFGIGGASNGFTIDLAVNKARGNANGEDVTYTNTHVNGGQNVTVISGGDTTLKGGVITGKNVIADIGGDLNIESLQDRSTFESKQKSAGLNASLCLPPFCYGASTAGGNFAKSNVNGDFLSVQEQSGIKAGDGGFQVSVGGNTDLKGGVLGSSQAAIDEGKNLLLTGSLSASDLINKDEHSASGFSLSGSVSGMLGDQSGRPGNLTEAQKDAAQQAGKPTASGGIGSVSGSQGSVTQSGISGGVVVIADQDKQLATGKSAQAVLAGLDREVTSASSQSAGALAKDWDAQQLQKDVDAQVAITEKFSKIAPKEIADFSNKKAAELEAQGASPDEIAKWKEGGIYRTALHGVSGGLTGGLGGALGAGVVAGSAEALETLQKNVEMALLEQGVGLEAARAMAQSLAQATAIGVGAAVGGEAGAATGLATDTNNRQLDRKEITLLERLQKGKSPAGQQRLADAACALTRCSAGLMDGPVKDALQAQEKRGQQYTAEQSLLLKTGEFAYSPVHKAIDAFDRATRTATNGGSEAVFNIIGWAADGLADQLKSAGRGAVNLGYQVATHGPFGNAQTPPDLFDDSNGPRPGGATVSVIPVPMCVPPVCALVSVPVATPGTPGYVPSNALLSDSGGEGAGNSDTAPRADGANSSVDSYVSGLYKLETPTGKASGRFEVEQTGPYNYRVPAGNTTIDIDGYKGTTMLDAKFVEKPANSPYIENSNVPSFLRDKIRNEQQWEFERYKAAINDPTVPFNRLEVLTNEPRAVPYFQSLMDQFNTPGTVKVVPTQIPKKVPGSR
ncbi:hemagglutinin repeat-containing protein [Massilia aurea]|uniref:hemagglutinin repeat-containing protein n=1 Tax=Massilia aurea TaxID=373040 RepID=UPI0031DAA0B3